MRSISAASSRATSESSPNARATALRATPSKRLAELRDGPVEALPEVRRPSPGSCAGAELVGELHVARAGVWALGEADEVRVAQRRRLLFGGVGDRAHPLGEPEIGRRLGAGLERLAPVLVGELDLFDRQAWIGAHDARPASVATVMIWSAIRRGAGLGAAAGSGWPVELTCGRAGDAWAPSARSSSERRTRKPLPARTARRRSVLIHARTVTGLMFSSSLTCWTVSHGSSVGSDLSGESAIHPRQVLVGRKIYHLKVDQRSCAHVWYRGESHYPGR